MSCQKAQGYLDRNEFQIAEYGNASKERRGAKEALELARSADKVVVAKGKKVVTFLMKSDRPDDETLLAHLLGPTGNLRAPTLRRGKTLLVGFNQDLYREVLGG